MIHASGVVVLLVNVTHSSPGPGSTLSGRETMTSGQRELFLFPPAVLVVGITSLWLNERFARCADRRVLGLGLTARRTLSIGMIVESIVLGTWAFFSLLV
jgi:hypothetical protein